MIIYKITNNINGKVYIGQTIKTLKTRWTNHQHSSNCIYLKHALDKYGIENFKIEEIERCESLEILNEREKFYIEFYQSMDQTKGYNLRSGGDNSLHSEESKVKMRKKRGPMTDAQKVNMKGPKSEEAKERLRTIWVGKKHTEESKAKMRASQKIAANKPERIEKLRIANTGKNLTEEHKIKISLVQKGQKRKPHSEETKRKIGEANKKRREMK